MGFFWLLILLLKGIDFLSWPVLALGYPLCASFQAIENDNNSDTRSLISYWILLSLINLFEYAFLKLLLWFQYWYYMKLMIVVCLVIPDFGRASHVYNQLVRSCIYMNPHVVISKFRSWKRVLVKKEDFLMLAEKYITDNGTGALEKLIASMNTKQNLDEAVPTTEQNEIQQNAAQNLDSETRKTVPIIEKSEAQQTNKVRLPLEQQDIKDLEMIEKEKVPYGNPANAALCSFKSNVNTISDIAKNEEIMAAKYREGGSSPHISASKNFQKEWTCAICQVTTTCEANLNSHLHGRSHKAACKALEAKNLSFTVEVYMKKNDKSGGESEKIMISTSDSIEQKITTCHPKTEQKNVGVVNGLKYYYRPKGTIDQENMSKSVDVIPKVQELQTNSGTSVLEMSSSRFRCDLCDVNCSSEIDMTSHLKGRRHLVQSQLVPVRK